MADFNANAMRLRLAIDLREIETLALELHTQALASPNARDFPGGTALHMLGPAASIAEWETQYEAVEAAERWDDDGSDRWAKQPKLDPATYQGDDNEQPLNVLESWSRIWREEFDQPTSLKATISREVDYLRKVIDRVCEENEYREPAHPAVFEMAAELRVLRRRMEDVLHFGIRPDLSKAKCTRCEPAPRLHREWTADPPGWRCPECKEPFTDREAARALGLMLYAAGSEKFVWIHDARDVAGIDRRTWHSWQDRLKMRMACDIKTHRVEVWWPDVRELVSAHKLRKAERAMKRQRSAS
jgi:hypothetical protein